MRVGGYQPRNHWLRRQLDRRWRRWLTWCITGAAVVSAVMAAFVAPRQATLRMRYEIARLSHEVEGLEGEQHRLLLDKEALVSPPALASELPRLGLEPVPRERVAYLTSSGDLIVTRSKPTPPRPSRPAREVR
jgi:hypothetical protein